MPSVDELIAQHLPAISKEARAELSRFLSFLENENQKQNLTRLTTPEELVFGHIWDAYELVRSGLLDFPAMDLGSGGGVPGIPAAILGGGEWFLAESEGNKARFLMSAVEELGLSEKIGVIEDRGENWLQTSRERIGSVVARAVGPVDRIFGWLRSCSTWNNLVLLKGPGWVKEWETFNKSRHRGKLRIESEWKYEVPWRDEPRRRTIVKLVR